MLTDHVYIVHIDYKKQWAKNRPLWNAYVNNSCIGYCAIKLDVLSKNNFQTILGEC